ncbi:hypothetical protein [Agromyces subbeticus]|uniref:hypothetical protein n=1 Tax=Agromyces subbeticus TaxID=293890 RepID=UPI00040D7D0E|nr:hypothetical protein [Agromyces subbeticus]
MIRLDLAAIGDAAADARSIRREFDESDDTSRQAAAACGHAGLAGTVERFASTWDDRRSGFAENLGKLGGALQGIEQAFTELDRSLATSESGA